VSHINDADEPQDIPDSRRHERRKSWRLDPPGSTQEWNDARQT